MSINRKKLLSIAIAVLLMLQILPLNPADAAMPEDLTGTSYLVVHGTDYSPAAQASSLKITQADGTLITPEADGSYNNVPAGAKLVLDYGFHLADGSDDGSELYTYTGDEYFTAALPQGLNFAATSDKVTATDTTSGDTYDLAAWSIAGNTLTVALTTAAEDSTGKGGAANDAYQGKWGLIHLEGTFKPLQAGDPTTTEITFGSQVITINRQPLPKESTLAKSGEYNPSANEITWTVTVTPPAGDPHMAYDGYSLIDEFGSGQTYIAGSFTMGGTPVPDSDEALAFDSSNQRITYTFPDTDPDTTGKQTVTYKTAPSDFAAENGSADNAEYSTFSNKVNLKRGAEPAAQEAAASLQLDWIAKSGVSAATPSEPTLAKWTVSVTVPGQSGQAISSAKITDTLPSDLELFTDPSHPVQIRFGSGSAGDVESGTGSEAGKYNVSGNTLTYLFPADSQPTAGTTATLTFYTRVKDSAKDSYLNSNGSIPFTNKASLTWNNADAEAVAPSDTATIANGVGAGGLLSKSSDGTINYAYSAGDPGTIHWTVTVNRNGITIKNAKITDTIPSGQELLLNSGHPITVTQKGTPDSVSAIFSDTASPGEFSSTDNFKNNFSYKFPEEAPGTGTITETYTLDYYTRILDTNPAAPGDNSGLDTLYSNGNSSGIVTFKNGVKLTRDGGAEVTTEGGKDYKSQIMDKTVQTPYNYNDRTLQWQIVVNRNKLPLTNALVTDNLPTGMTLLIDSGHPFTVTAAGSGALDTSTAAASGATSFSYDLPTPTSDQYTITFWTLMDEATLKTQWNGSKDFTNQASLTADEIPASITKKATAKIKNPVITKAYDYTSGSDYISWSAVINPGQMTLPKGVITDVLNPGLQLDPASLKLYTVAVNSGSGEAVPSSSGTLVPGGDYSVTLPSAGNSNTLTVTLPANTSSAYRLEFITNILVDDLNATNSITLSGSAGDPSGSADSTQIQIVNLYSSGGSGSNTLTVHKTDTAGAPLVNAEFQLLNVNKQPILKGGNPVTRTTDAAGDAVFDNLPAWVFYVEEIEPPAGYLLPSGSIFGSGERLSGSATVPVADALALGTVAFEKKGAEGIPLSGGTFTLTGKNYLGNDVSLTASAVNGIVSFTDVPLGKAGEPYTITETVPPAGHSPNSSTLTASVLYNPDKTGLDITVTPDELVNTPLPGTVSFTKTGADGVLLSGGEFTLTGTDYNGGLVNKTASAVNGIVSFTDVPLSKAGEPYTITETDPPAGYLQPGSPDILTAAVEYNPARDGVVATLHQIFSETVVTEFTNTPALGSISFAKVSTGGSPLSGGIFMLTGTDDSGNPVAMTASSAAGIVTFNDVPLGSDYKIRETSPPAGYILSDTELTVSVVYTADKTGVITSVTPDTLTNTPSSSLVTIYGSIKITKTSEDGSKLAGAVFTLYSKTNGKIIATASSDVKGIASFDHLPQGQYVVKETKAPEGYSLNTKSIDVSISDSTTRSFTVVNQREEALPGSIEITKTDERGNLLKDAEFTLYDAGGTALQVVVTDADGHALFTKLPPGTYTISETRVPPGFSAAPDSMAVSLSSGQTLKLTIENQTIKTPTVPETPTIPETPTVPGNSLTGSLRIEKITKDSAPLSGAEFTLFDEKGTAVGRAVSGKDGMVYFEKLAPGKYTVRETAAPEGYALFADPLSIDLKEAQVLSYTLRNNLLNDENPSVLGWSDANTPSTGGNLPKAGGMSGTFLLAIFGLILLSAGLLLAKPQKYRRKLG